MNLSASVQDVLSIRVTDRQDMDLQLHRGVARLRERALSYGDRGILVTRHSSKDFTLELHPNVPYGTTLERDVS